ncbi:MAG: hypothetical protein D6719_00965 [Candidatus Dadabacteria bacterium]|nr:MAG: hypothetical protein D6719_00965 [Candidatus Dadabacteria bacterium]
MYGKKLANKFKLLSLIVVFSGYCFAGIKPAQADDKGILSDPGKISGLVMSDFYWVAQNHRSELEDENGFWFRRIYLTYDKKLQDNLDARIRFELNSPGDFETETKLDPFVKDAYLKYTSGLHSVYFGISSTPTWDLVEHHWGYRSVEKTPLDLQKFGASRDFGLALKGYFDADKMFGYHFMVGNGASNKSETNEDKKIHLALSAAPAEGVILQVLGDYESADNNKDKYTLQGFAGYKADWGRLGLLYAHQVREQGTGVDDLELDLASAYIVGNFSENLAGYLRVDRMFDPNPKGEDISYIPFASDAKSTFVLAGLDYEAFKNVHLMPNVEMVFYDAVGGAEDPDNDVIPRFTLFYKF